MESTECVSTKKLFDALESDTKPLINARDIEQARQTYDEAPENSEQEIASLKQLARYYPASSEKEALAPNHDYGSDSERRMLEIHNKQHAIEAAGGPTNSEMILLTKNRRRSKHKPEDSI